MAAAARRVAVKFKSTQANLQPNVQENLQSNVQENLQPNVQENLQPNAQENLQPKPPGTLEASSFPALPQLDTSHMNIVACLVKLGVKHIL